MKTRLFATLSLATALCACTTTGTLPPGVPGPTEAALIALEVAAAPKRDRLDIAAAAALEIGARLRCPRTPVELEVLTAGRLLFDAFVRGKVEPQSAAIIDGLRGRTNVACGIAS